MNHFPSAYFTAVLAEGRAHTAALELHVFHMGSLGKRSTCSLPPPSCCPSIRVLGTPLGSEG